ncbi:alanine--tRNA ligase [Aquihabitans sp. G128]|uniref:alanine--tRNA ligase n=1 Tax=Aquihabitans sp. G128 TaxID=2849779 RepID=UPI001C2451DB|nr:alanine--tRNA ligase [Aquihabitans sp. G128]QXC61861.1 alanine--tRNA ligase [Aquihabitans sp. G128]
MKAQELRQAWTEFWVARQHTDVPSAGLIPHHPSAPMFTNSGMMPFVPYFIGEEKVPWVPPRASSIQRCVRAGGKHNDLDEIGWSPRHLSFFEMLGNFSFGDYFKPDAIRWAWEFSTEVLGLDGDRIWVTCHVDDDEAVELWVDEVGFPIERIQRLDKDNFWEMGDTGPCGPSSELFWDFGAEVGPDGGPANPAAEHRYVEFWNLVFQQSFRLPDGSLRPLESKNIDTGGGLERILGVVDGSPSVFTTDELAQLVGEAESLTGVRLGRDAQSDRTLKLLADHARTMTFLVNDGVIPSNEDRGYVLRRIIRRAVSFAYLLGVETAVAPALAQRTIDLMADAYPELRSNAETVLGVLGREEDQFRRTLRGGLNILDGALADVDEGGELPGSVAFLLHDTHGFPLEVTTEITEQRGYGVDQAGFDVDMAEQRRRAREGGKKGAVAVGDEADAFAAVLAAHGTSEFVGREVFELEATVVGVVPAADGTTSVFLDRTPFYAESGGQVGDTGYLTGPGFVGEVTDTTYALPGLHRHVVRVTEGDAPSVGSTVDAAIDVARRDAIRRNHTATHLLHWALREVLGTHVKQQGSYVAPDRLRFDFSHFEAITPEQVRAIEDLVNHDVLANEPVRHFETTKAAAVDLGAIAFFGEKYGDVVRVLEAGPHSTELCGGTHVRRTGDIGPTKVVSEGSIGSNLRRIEAITGFGPIERIRTEEAELAAAAAAVGVPRPELLDGIDKRLAELRDLRDEVKSLKAKLATGGAPDLAGQAVDGIVVARVDGLSRDDLRSLGVAVRDQPDVRAVVLIGAPEAGGVALVAASSKESGIDAGGLIADAARAVGGGGGKNPELAVAGGKDATRIDEALDLARTAAGIA